MTTPEENFYTSQTQQMEAAIHQLLATNPEFFQPPVPGSVEAEQLEKVQQRLANLDSLSEAEMEAYYKEYGFYSNIDWLSPPEGND